MKIEKIAREDQQVQVIAEMDAEVLERYSRRAARKISKEAKIPGFRPGKAPFEVIQRIYGEDFIQQQAIELLVDNIYPDVLKEAEIEPAGPGALEEIVSVDPPKFSFIVPLKPEVELSDYRSIRMDYEPEAISDEEVEEFINNLRKNFASTEPVERPIEDEDLVFGLLKGMLSNPEEDEDPEIIKESPNQWSVGGSEFQPDSWPYEGFSKELIGLSEGDEKDIVYTYPEDSALEKFAGKEVTFHVTIQSVKVLVLPELDDEFVKMVGPYENLEDLREKSHARLDANKKEEYENDFYTKLIDEKIVEESTVKYPPQMLEDEIQHSIENIKSNLASRNLDFDTFLKIRNTDQETYIEEEIKPAAEKSLARTLVLNEIAKVEELQIPEGELESAVAQTMVELQSLPEFEKYRPAQKMRDLTNAVAMDTANRLFNQHLLERLKSIATGEFEAEQEKEAEEAKVSEEAEIAAEDVNTEASEPEVNSEEAPEE